MFFGHFSKNRFSEPPNPVLSFPVLPKGPVPKGSLWSPCQNRHGHIKTNYFDTSGAREIPEQGRNLLLARPREGRIDLSTAPLMTTAASVFLDFKMVLPGHVYFGMGSRGPLGAPLRKNNKNDQNHSKYQLWQSGTVLELSLIHI